MKHAVLFAILLSAFLPGASMSADPAEKCFGVSRAESFRQMSQDALAEHRKRVAEQTPDSVAEAVCESTAALTLSDYQALIDQARQENLKAGGPEFDPAELYFFLVCGDDRVNLSPLAYHAFNLNRDEFGFIGDSTLAIVWMSMGYLDIKDPDQNRSFIDAVNRVLAYARKRESQTEIEMYEDLLEQIKGFREDYLLLVEECRSE
jgi:hypothetical protein